MQQHKCVWRNGVFSTIEIVKFWFISIEEKFNATTATVGNEFFVEYFNISTQINESQFQFDFREGNFNQFNAIYGGDSCEHKEDTNLIEFVTIHQSDTIVVISVDGSNNRQRGTNTLSCDSNDYGLMHLTSDFMSVMIVVEESVIGRDINLNEMGFKGGEGMEKNTSLRILDEGCQLGGIASERGSSFFIPVLEEVKSTTQASGGMDLSIRGKLLLPHKLSQEISMKDGDEEELVRKGIEEEGFASENEIHSVVTRSEWEKVREETEVSVWIVFGKADSPSATESFIVKNRSESVGKGDERIVEGGIERKSYLLLIVIIMTVILVIVLIGFILFVVRWRKQKRRTKELEEIVNDNIKKDPKAFEMVTMEMPPEEQKRRAEREAEKKNEERIKKRVYEKSLGHSESSERLLSESGSTEYILGRDSEKIPQWALEKADDEEEEKRKRKPSPSISSTSTTDTSDTDTTFVRGEDLCPRTSSMSNLVDAMACSSPHEKLIVDLRDSLFMLLHGRNEKKDLANGTLKEREVTGAQMLFWVAGGALFSFEDGEDDLPSLPNLSPHIVLFSEHMVICIALHSDFSSDDSDTSSISSSTVVTSESDDDDDDDRNDRDSLPSSAYEEEDEDAFKKECLRWKAPEFLINKKMEATKKSVVFSIGMMAWESLTLEVPFVEDSAEAAGQKIVNGERQDK
ncbi:uncharacterized protein MONOS_16960 [Monocercomonoides exilis]|uniref:uncharacterized protein n=1 Tax=Monocercomonoides exilis TaxID=2049356 RepID=UPI0035594CFB|nr:hypothetical protein MONOS_16960 [Monocercomonoides exilis]